jgi:hypothetical protein
MMNSEGGRIVVTASGVHDPQSPGGAQGETATLGDLAGMMQGRNFEMVDGGPFNADKAYKDSKVSPCDVDSHIYISPQLITVCFVYIALQCSIYTRVTAAP